MIHFFIMSVTLFPYLGRSPCYYNSDIPHAFLILFPVAQISLLTCPFLFFSLCALPCFQCDPSMHTGSLGNLFEGRQPDLYEEDTLRVSLTEVL